MPKGIVVPESLTAATECPTGRVLLPEVLPRVLSCSIRAGMYKEYYCPGVPASWYNTNAESGARGSVETGQTSPWVCA